jgi:hypothetical protein
MTGLGREHSLTTRFDLRSTAIVQPEALAPIAKHWQLVRHPLSSASSIGPRTQFGGYSTA